MVDRMHAAGTGAGAVVDGSGRFIGLVTEREIVRRVFNASNGFAERLKHIYQYKSAQDMTAWDVMIPNPDTLSVHDNVEDALDVITCYGYRYMPVLSKRDRLAGIVDSRELYHHVRNKSKALIESQNNLLSSFMGREPYGGAGGYAVGAVA
jgi:CBS domain-containing protein